MIIVTGGAGFIGSVLVACLNAKGIEDILIVDSLGESDKWQNLVPLKFKDYIHKENFLQLLSKNVLDRDIQGVFHLGASSSTTETDMDYLYSNNFEYSRTLASFALDRGVRFIYASSAATYGLGEQGFRDQMEDLSGLRPLNRYGYSKHLFDLWAEKKGALKEIVGLKFFNVYGPNESHKGDQRSVVHKAFYQAKENGVIKLFRSNHADYVDGGQQRDFIYVKDCAAAMYWFFENPEKNGLLNLGTGEPRTWNELAGAVFSALGKPPRIEYIDIPERLRGQYQNYTAADMEAVRATGYPNGFTSLEDGVREYVTSYLEVGERKVSAADF